jgi:hypothetical protein
MAARMGIDFDHAQLASVVMEDAAGGNHTFDVVSRLCATGHVMEALEVREGEIRGNSFAVLASFEVDAMALFGELYERMRQGLAARHVQHGDLGWHLTEGDRLSGRIEWDDARDGQVPCVVVDGRTFTWDQVGKMLMAYEGFVVEMKVRDHIEIVDDRVLGVAADRKAGGSTTDD